VIALGLCLVAAVAFDPSPITTFRLNGTVAAVVTVFDSKLNVDYSVINAQAAQLMQQGIRSVFVCGTTGESLSLTVPERKLIAEAWRSAATQYGLTLIVHVGTATPLESVDLAIHAQQIGADAIATMATFFFKPSTASDVAAFLAQISAAAPKIPLYYYYIPSMTGVSISVADILLAATSSHHVPTLRGAKFSDADLYEFGRCVGLRDTYGSPFNLLFGRDEMLLGALAIGADGAVGSTYNLPFMAPIYNRLLSAYASGNMTAAQAEQARSRELVYLMKSYGGGALKAMLDLSGVLGGLPRPPFVALTPTQLSSLKQDLVKNGFLS